MSETQIVRAAAVQIAPVANPARGDARKATAAATSSGVPSRPSGMRVKSFSFCSGVITSVMAVSMKPGATAFTRTPRGASSLADVFVSPITPAFEAE